MTDPHSLTNGLSKRELPTGTQNEIPEYEPDPVPPLGVENPGEETARLIAKVQLELAEMRGLADKIVTNLDLVSLQMESWSSQILAEVKTHKLNTDSELLAFKQELREFKSDLAAIKAELGRFKGTRE